MSHITLSFTIARLDESPFYRHEEGNHWLDERKNKHHSKPKEDYIFYGNVNDQFILKDEFLKL